MPIARPRRRTYASASSAAWAAMPVNPTPMPPPTPTAATKIGSEGARVPRARPPAVARTPMVTTSLGFQRATR